MNACLLVIDAQQSFVHRPYFMKRDVPDYLHAQNALIETARKRAMPIVRIFHVERDPHSAFSRERGYVRPIDGLAEFQPAAVFEKARHSA